ncbi:MAG: hypothetical protein SGI84_02955 [Gemmatimonadota bacterium]|nr:hypothetical protein [Gemmatimonadota bacterium]
MKRFLLALVLMSPFGGVVTQAAAQTCDETCVAHYNEHGTHDGNSCLFGTQGFDCVATIGVCSIATTGCGGETEEDSFAYDAVQASFDHGFLSNESGLNFFVLVPCPKGGSAPIIISLEAFDEMILSERAVNVQRDLMAPKL